jgi:hypothetical protein
MKVNDKEILIFLNFLNKFTIQVNAIKFQECTLGWSSNDLTNAQLEKFILQEISK